MIERRKHSRYRVKDGLLAVVGQNSSPTGQVIGQIVDIGSGGLALLCRKEELRLGEEAILTMMYDNGKRPHSFPFRFDIMPVSMLTASPSKTAGNGDPKVCCNVRFKVLTYYQKNWIRQIIEDYTEAVDDTDVSAPVRISA